jgi:hypothetical protein
MDQTPADMVGAGIGQAEQPPVNIIDALRSRGTMPSGLMESMRPPMMTPATMAASAITGGLNPTGVNPVDQRLHQENQENMQRMQMIDKIQERQRIARKEQLAASNTVLKDMLFGPNAIEDEKTRGPIAQQYFGNLKETTGLELPSSAVTAWTRGGPSSPARKEMAILLAGADAATDPAEKQALTEQAHKQFLARGGKDEEWPVLQKTLINPVYLESVNLPTKDKLAQQHAELETKKIANWSARNTEFKDRGEEKGVASWANDYSKRHFGKSIYEMNPENPVDAAQMQVARDYATLAAKKDIMTKEEAALDKFKAQERFRTDENIRQDEAKAKLTGKTPKVLLPAAVDKILAPFNQIDTFAIESRAMRAAWERANDAGLLPKDSGLYEKGRAGIKRAIDPNNIDLLTLRQLVAPAVVGLVDRGLNDEKGSRAMKMFEEQVAIVRNNPTKEGYERLFSLYDYLFGRLAQKQIAKLQMQKGRIPDDVIDHAEGIVKSIYPEGFPREPKFLQPKAVQTQASPLGRIVINPAGKEYSLAPGAPVPEGWRLK